MRIHWNISIIAEVREKKNEKDLFFKLNLLIRASYNEKTLKECRSYYKKGLCVEQVVDITQNL